MNWTAALASGGGSGPVEERLALQGLWDWFRRRESWAQAPLFPAFFSLAAYLACCAPFLALDCLLARWPALRRYKLQPRASPSAAAMAACAARSLYDHLLCILPVTLAHWYWRARSLPARAPPLPRLLLEVAACLLLFDGLYFAWHLLHHRVAWLYRTFHRAHHRHVSPFALSTQASSRWELLWLGLFAALVPPLLRCHPLSETAFFLANIWLAVEDHAGYDLPCATHRLVPFGLYGGAPHHDRHHRQPACNFAPYFTHWDRLCGTLRPPDAADLKPARD